MDKTEKLEICKYTRSLAAEALVSTLKELLSEKRLISEAFFRDTWLKKMRENNEIFPDGWYIPPPHGLVTLFASGKDVSRINVSSMRPETNWPREDVFLDLQDGIIFVYASPVSKKSGMIGDFGATLYLGNNPKIQNHLKKCLTLTREIFDHAREKMMLSDIASFAHTMLAANEFRNDIASSTDPTGTNIGHTIPASYEDWDAEELNLLANERNNWPAICKLISLKRVFVNSSEKFLIKPGMAFTIEPRPQSNTDSNIPMVYFHTIALFYEDSTKELLTQFDEVFRILGMEYLL
jgi:hypothetical protein